MKLGLRVRIEFQTLIINTGAVIHIPVNSVSGSLGIIGCPILEDEIVHAIKRDKDIARVFVIENEDSKNLLRKLRRAQVEAKICPIKQDELDHFPEDGFNVLILMKSMGLHEDPQRLRKEVLESVNLIAPKCRSILLFYGLCGNAFKDISEIEKECGRDLFMLTDDQGRPVDDCIAAVLGGTDGYYRLLKRYPGVFYLTPAWAEHWRELIYKMELTRGIDKNDLSMLKWLFEIAGYKMALKLDTGLGDQETFERHVDDFVREFNFQKASLEKEFITLDAIEHSYDRAKNNMIKRNDQTGDP